MSIDVFSMSLTRRAGKDNTPDYSLTIYEDGRVVYEGRANVEVMGKVEDSIDDNRFRMLLTAFKESGFLSFNDNYTADGMPDSPYAVTSFSVAGENNEIRTKKVTHCYGDTSAPENLTYLENKIDEVVGSEKWVGKPYIAASKPPSKSDQNTSSLSKNAMRLPSVSFKKKSMKIVSTIVVIVVVICLLLYAFQSGIISSFFPEEESSHDYISPEITVFTTASNVTGLGKGNYTQKYHFERGDTIYVYQEYINVFHNVSGIGMCNFSVNIAVFDSNAEKWYSESADVYLVDQVESGCSWSFKTNKSWLDGWYSVTSHLVDHISNKNASGAALFCLDCRQL